MRIHLLPLLPLLLCAMRLPARASNAPVVIAPTQVVAAALDYSPALKSAGEDVAAAGAARDQARAAGLPSLGADGRAAFYEGLNDFTIGPEMTLPAVENRYAAAIGITQPLFTGGRISGNRRMAEDRRRGAESSLRARRSDVIHRTLTAYWTWSKAYYAAGSMQASVRWMEAHEADISNLHKAGLATENDALSTSVKLDQTRLKLEQAQRQTRLARAMLEFLTGIELPDEAIPMPADIPEAPATDGNLDWIGSALTNRDDLQALQFDCSALRHNVAVQRAGYYPHFFANARYEIGRPNQLDIPPEDEWNDDAYLAVYASWNLFDWGLTRARVIEAGARANQAMHAARQQKDQVVYEVRMALINLENALTRLRVARRAAASAGLDLKAATDLWKNGMARHSDVLDAQSRLTEAEFEQISAAGDTALARAELEHAAGTLDQ